MTFDILLMWQYSNAVVWGLPAESELLLNNKNITNSSQNLSQSQQDCKNSQKSHRLWCVAASLCCNVDSRLFVCFFLQNKQQQAGGGAYSGAVHSLVTTPVRFTDDWQTDITTTEIWLVTLPWGPETLRGPEGSVFPVCHLLCGNVMRYKWVWWYPPIQHK